MKLTAKMEDVLNQLLESHDKMSWIKAAPNLFEIKPFTDQNRPSIIIKQLSDFTESVFISLKVNNKDIYSQGAQNLNDPLVKLFNKVKAKFEEIETKEIDAVVNTLDKYLKTL